MTSIRTTHLDDIFVVETDGPLDPEWHRETLLVALSADRPCSVIDCRRSVKLITFGEALRAVLNLQGHPAFGTKWIAIVVEFGHGFELAQAEEHAAQTKGLTLRAFMTMETALAWLKGSSGSPCAG